MQPALVTPVGSKPSAERHAVAAKCPTPGGRAGRWRSGGPRHWARYARRANACRHRCRRQWVPWKGSCPASLWLVGCGPEALCWNSNCVVKFGSHCSCHRAGPFLTHVRGRTGKHCQPATPISLPRGHFGHRCGCLPSPDHFFPAGASLRPRVSQMLRTNVQNNNPARQRGPTRRPARGLANPRADSPPAHGRGEPAELPSGQIGSAPAQRAPGPGLTWQGLSAARFLT